MSQIERAKQIRQEKMIDVAMEIEERLTPELRLKMGLAEKPSPLEPLGYSEIMGNLVSASLFDGDTVLEILEWIHEGAIQAKERTAVN